MAQSGLWLAALLGASSGAQLSTTNYLPNPSFELVEPPAPTVQCPVPVEAPAELWRPRTWDAWPQDGALMECPADAAAAHSGARSVHFTAAQGRGNLRYQPIPLADRRPWTVQLWLRGTGQLRVTGWDVTSDPWKPGEGAVFALSTEWQRAEYVYAPPEGARKWMLELQTEGPTDVWIDDVLLTRDGLQPIGLPPVAPLARDAETLLYLSFEEPLDEDAFFVKPDARLTDQGRFGKALSLGAEGYVACSANENLDPQQGTIEVWVKLLSPGNDGIARPMVTVPGPEGMWLGKDQYSHVGFGFSSGWARTSGVTVLGYAYNWQPGVWRHLAACWDADLLELFVDGKLIGWEPQPKLSRSLGPELGLGSAGLELDDLRISKVVRYRVEVPPQP